MFRSVATKLTQKLVDSQTIQQDNQCLYSYGIQQGLTMILNLTTSILIGLLCGMFWQSILFYLSYIPLRIFSGGYHAKTPLKCYLFSIIMMFAILLTMKWIQINPFICIIVLISAFALIAIFAPVEDLNKPLDAKERRVYRKRAIIISTVELIASFVLIWLQLFNIAKCLIWGIVITVIILALGIVRNHIQCTSD